MDAHTAGGPACAAPSPSASSSSDFYSVDAPKEQLVPQLPDTQDHPPARMDHDSDDDSSSEMDLSSSSRSSTPDPDPEPAPLSAPLPSASSQTASKRKLSDACDTDSAITGLTDAQVKKPRLAHPPTQKDGTSRPTPTLTPEIWQHVFWHLPPAMLSRCLRVSKDFNDCLTNMVAPQHPNKDVVVQVLDSNAIWAHSRKTYFPQLPRPLSGVSELAMLQLIGGALCQFCGKHPLPIHATSVFNAGPGQHGVRVIWPFAVRSCGECLEYRILKDVQVLADQNYKDLRFGVPHGFRSPDLHFVSDSVRFTPGGIPANLRFSKINYIPHLEAIKGDAEHAKTLGDGAADEWRKGLHTQGKQALADSARWEKWELQMMRPGVNFAHVLREYDLSSFPRYVEGTQSKPAGVNGTQPSMAANGMHPLPQPVHVFPQNYGTHFSHAQNQFPPYQAAHQPYVRHVRNAQEVEEARQARKANIESRCRELEPPLEPNVLQHMESFQAAMQITTPMTDSAWEMLRPRILAQREAAELTEHERASQLAALQAALPSMGSDNMISKPARETYDREYEQAQEPLRRKLGEYADDYINGQWGGARMLNKDNAPIFAVSTLVRVYQRYMEDKGLGLLPSFDPPRKMEGAKQGTPPLEPFLSLDNMKWVYDNKVRPLTDLHRREHFICAGCPEEKKPKWFAFEGLIQHYGAKHTTAFSKGNIVVHWQSAEWPEQAPFHENPLQWLKGDRRASDFRNQGRARHTPQANHQGPFPVPTSAPSFTENPYGYHTGPNGYSNVSPGYPAAHSASPSSPAGSNGYFQQQASSSDQKVDYDAQVNQLTSDIQNFWGALEGIKGLQACIRVQAVIYHTATQFFKQFRQQPQLDFLTDALTTNPTLRQLKNSNGLACKSCVAAGPNARASSYWTRIMGEKLFNTSSLITHFKLMHQSPEQSSYIDWTTDMIEPPDSEMLQELLRTPGMDDDKLALVSAAFPRGFSSPLPKIGLVTEGQAGNGVDGVAKGLLDRFSKKPKNQPKKKKASNSAGDREDSQGPVPGYADDEYDPSRPAFVQRQENVPDPSQFDTDARKKAAPALISPAVALQTGFNFEPETLAALQSVLKEPPINDRRSRSPSVGGHAAPSSSHTAGNTAAATPTGQPDIAAILAALQSGAQTATPPASVSHRSGSVPRQSHHEQHSKPRYESPVTSQPEIRRSSSRYDTMHQTVSNPPTSRGLEEIHAALNQNSHLFEQNRYHSHAQVSYEAPAAHPTRYQTVYANDQQSYAGPLYRDAPVRYVQIPTERDHAAPPYHQEQRVPPKFVDQYGNPLELIPHDAAPAPVQYAPYPYEQHLYGRRHEQPIYTNVAPPAHYQRGHDDRRSVYYEQSPNGNGVSHR